MSTRPTLQQALGYEPTTAKPLHRLVQRAAATRAGAWTLAKTLQPLDEATLKITGGRHTAAGLLAGVPVITLHTTGARSGLRRSHPLIGIPLDGTLGIIGTNYGQRNTPGWVYNLESNPRADVTHRSTTVPVLARHAAQGELEAVFRRSATIYPGYEVYRSRVSHRPIRVFVLDHAP